VVSVAFFLNYKSIFVTQGFFFFNQPRQIHLSSTPLRELNLAKSIEEFINDRKNYTPSVSVAALRQRLSQQIPSEHKAQAIYHKDFNSLVLASEQDEEIDAAYEVIRKNTEKLNEFGLANQFSNKLGRLLYTLKRTDKFLEIFNRDATNQTFRTISNLHLLMTLLENEQRHLEALRLFADFIDGYKHEMVNLKTQILMFAKSAHTLNSIESMQILERAIQRLSYFKNKMNYKFTDPKTQFYVCLLCVKQNKPNVAQKVLDIIKYNAKTKTYLEINLSIIVNAKANKISTALHELQLLVALEKKMFQETSSYLKEAIEASANEKERSKYDEILSILSTKQLLSPQSLEEHLESEHPDTQSEQVKAKRPSVKQFRQNTSLSNRRKDDRQIFKEASLNYNAKNYNGVMTSFEKLLLNLEGEHNFVPLEALDVLSISIRNDKVGTSTQIKRIIELVKEKTKAKWPINSQIDIFLRLSELDPFYSLEFLAENDVLFQKKHPSVHKNIMAIGLCLIDQIDVALYQIESILDIDTNEGLEGLIFPKTLEVLKSVVLNSSDNNHKNRLIEILLKMKRENRITSFDITELNLSPSEKSKDTNIPNKI